MHLIRGLKATRKESGQVLVFFALWLPVILLFVGFAVDFGFGYLTKLRLAKAADAAALKVMLFYGKGQTSAIAIGQSVFSTNITTNSNLPYVTTPSASISFNTAGAEPVVNVVATAQIKTFFIWLAGIPTLSVSDTSQATRPPVIISLVLDRSGSMVANGGSTALPPAVDAFIVYFIPGTDQIGQVSFSTLATNDVPVTTNFVSPVNSSMSSMAFTGATYAQAGLADAQSQITGVASPPVGTQMVVVFFTDGWAKSIFWPFPPPISQVPRKVVTTGVPIARVMASGAGSLTWSSPSRCRSSPFVCSSSFLSRRSGHASLRLQPVERPRSGYAQRPRHQHRQTLFRHRRIEPGRGPGSPSRIDFRSLEGRETIATLSRSLLLGSEHRRGSRSLSRSVSLRAAPETADS